MASKRHLRRKACEGKQRWDRNDAKSARYAAAIVRQKTGEPVEAYHCKWCKGFHIGHPPKREQWRLNTMPRYFRPL